MPVFKDFAENGDLLQSRDEPLNTENFSRYIEENGIEKAQGYLDAIQDISNQMEKYFSKKLVEVTLPSSAAVITRETKKLYSENLNLIEFANLTLQKDKKYRIS